jgi:hypothetical protein
MLLLTNSPGIWATEIMCIWLTTDIIRWQLNLEESSECYIWCLVGSRILNQTRLHFWHATAAVACLCSPLPYHRHGKSRRPQSSPGGPCCHFLYSVLVMATLAKRKRTKASIMVFSSISKRSEYLH